MQRQEMQDISRWSPQFQTGLGVGVTDTVKIHLLYQQILGLNPNFRVNPVNQIGTMTYLPTQHSLLVGFTLLF
ncbi:MAG: hypothetical protein H0T84_07470 [Tatlockia sp.]|nr:hypothetical protein [Tatlockia sp.]